jgi:transposase
MPKRLLPFVPRQFVLEQVTTCIDQVTVVCRVRSPASRCPTCRRASTRTHSHYRRSLADLPWQGRSVRICLQVRRLRCANQHCAQRIFAERAEQVVGAHPRRTVRLGDIQRSVGLALGGEAGTRLVERLSMPDPHRIARLRIDEMTGESPLSAVSGASITDRHARLKTGRKPFSP